MEEKEKKNDLPLVELYSPMYRLVKYRTTTAERKNETLNVRNKFPPGAIYNNNK